MKRRGTKLIFALALLMAAAEFYSVAWAFDYTNYGSPSSSDTFRMLDQPPAPQIAAEPQMSAAKPVALPSPMLSSPPSAVMPAPQPVSSPILASPSPVTNYVPPTNDGPACIPPCLSESQWYTKIEYFHWNERIDGANWETENGPLYTVGYEHRSGRERFRAELFGSQVDSFSVIDFGGGDVEPLHAHTNYLGLRAEYDLLFEPESLPELDFFVGLGTRFWIRDLPDAFTDEGSFVEGYQETWWTIYPYMGMETRRLPQPDLQWYGSGRIGLTAITYENANFFPPTTLYPLPGVEAQFEGGIRGQQLFLGTYFEAMSWSQSQVVRGSVQPTSKMYTVGLKTGVSF